MKQNPAVIVVLAPVAALLAVPWSGFLLRQLALERPAWAQASEDWSTAPIAIPAAPTGGSLLPAEPAAEPLPSPRREIQLPPPELRRPQAPLLPGGAPSIRIAPGEGVRPLPPMPGRVAPQAPATAAPARPRVTSLPVMPGPTGASPLPTPPRPATPRRATPPGAAGSSSTPFPSLLESLPPGTIRPLPGETLPGSTPAPQPGGASPSPLQGMPPPPPPPQAVPPPPWADPVAQKKSQEVPWGWLLLGLGGGAITVLLAQGKSTPARRDGPLESLGIRIVAQPDPGVQTLTSQPGPSLPPTDRQE